jgi:hypothetical protein
MKVLRTSALAVTALCGACAGTGGPALRSPEAGPVAAAQEPATPGGDTEAADSPRRTAGTADVRVAMTLLPATALEDASKDLTAPAAPTEPAKDASADDGWKFALTPYLWLPNINGTLRYDLPSGSGDSAGVKTGPNSYLENLNFALMATGDLRKGRWSIFTDLIYLHFASEGSTVKDVEFQGSGGRTSVSGSLDAGTETDLSASLVTLAGGYAVVDGPGTTLDLIGGARYLRLHAETDWELSTAIAGPGGSETFQRSGSVSESADVVDGIIGARGAIRFGDSQWFVPYYVDLGAGSSDLTWQGMVGLSYHWNWGDLSLVYRYISYDQPSDKLLQDVEFAGPAFAVTIRF